MTTAPTSARGPARELTELRELVDRGSQALSAGDLDAARDAFEAAASRFPEEPVGHNNLGALYMGLGDPAAAEVAFARVVELLPENANCRFNLALARFKQEKHAEAEADFAAVVAAEPEDAEARNNLGTCRFLTGKTGQARADFTAALQLQSNYPSAVLNLCDLEVGCGNADAAKGLCLAYLEHHQDGGVLRRLLELLDAQGARAQQAEG